MEIRSSWSLINPNMYLTTSEHTLEFYENLPSGPNLINYIYRKRNSFLLVKFYNSSNSKELIQKEMKMINQLNKPKKICLSILENIESNSKPFLIYELKDFLPLSIYLNRNESFDKNTLIFDLLMAVKYIHSKNLIHSCLNLETIFINKENKIKLIGFEDCIELHKLNTEAAKLKERMLNQNKHFKAPELLKPGYNINQKIDIWSLGCIIFKIFYPSISLEKFDDEKQTLIENEKSPILRQVFKFCFFVDPALRGSLKVIKNVLNSTPPSFQGINEFFNRSTTSLVKSILKNSKDSLNPRYLQKLFEKNQNQSCTLKFLNCLTKRTFDYPEKALKGIWLIHIYSLKFDTFEYRSVFKTIEQRIEKNFSMYPQQNNFIKNYLETVNQKYEILEIFNNNINKISTTWKLVEYVNEYAVLIIKYIKQLLRFATMLLSQNEKLLLFHHISETIINEVLLLYSYLLENLNNLSDLTNSFFKIRKLISIKFELIYSKYPLIKINLSTPLNLPICIHMLTQETILQNDSVYFELSPSQVIFSDHFLGDGLTSNVFKGIYDNKEVAVKVFKSSKDSKYSRRELKFTQLVIHPNVIKLYGYFYNESELLNLVLEYCEGGPLNKYLDTNKLTFKEKLKIALDIAKGMLSIHSNLPPIIHRDLKSRNILLCKPNLRGYDEPFAKIADFGFARYDENDEMTKTIGSYSWMAPEVFSGSSYTTASDIYSFAVVLLEIFAEDNRKEVLSLLSHKTNKKPDITFINGEGSGIIRNLITRCWDDNPGNRPDFREIIRSLKSLRVFTQQF